MEHHPEGIFLEADTYSALVKTIQRDCRVLESFKIMDYSLLVGIHNLDQAAREKAVSTTKVMRESSLFVVKNTKHNPFCRSRSRDYQRAQRKKSAKSEVRVQHLLKQKENGNERIE